MTDSNMSQCENKAEIVIDEVTQREAHRAADIHDELYHDDNPTAWVELRADAEPPYDFIVYCMCGGKHPTSVTL